MSAERGRDGPPTRGDSWISAGAVDAAAAGERALARATGRIGDRGAARDRGQQHPRLPRLALQLASGRAVDAGLPQPVRPAAPAGRRHALLRALRLPPLPAHRGVAPRHRPLPNVRNYLRNRALRILPAYWVVLAAVAVVLPAALLRLSRSELVAGPARQPARTCWSAMRCSPRTTAGVARHRIGPAWSLAVEVVFYLTLPVLAVLAAAWCPRGPAAPGSGCSPCSCHPRSCCCWARPGKRPASAPARRSHPGNAILAAASSPGRPVRARDGPGGAARPGPASAGSGCHGSGPRFSGGPRPSTCSRSSLLTDRGVARTGGSPTPTSG